MVHEHSTLSHRGTRHVVSFVLDRNVILVNCIRHSVPSPFHANYQDRYVVYWIYNYTKTPLLNRNITELSYLPIDEFSAQQS